MNIQQKTYTGEVRWVVGRFDHERVLQQQVRIDVWAMPGQPIPNMSDYGWEDVPTVTAEDAERTR